MNVKPYKTSLVLGIAALGALIATKASAELHDLSEMNILFLCPEDWSTEAISVYGNEEVITPNLEKLAESATVFTKAYNQNPVCNPSRSSFNTGLRPETTGVLSNDDEFDENVPEWATTIAESMESHPIQTYLVGKLFHHNWDAVQQVNAFDGVNGYTPENYPGMKLKYQIPKGTPPNPEKNWTYTSDLEWDAKMVEAMKIRKQLWANTEKGSDQWEEGRRVFQNLSAEIIGDSGNIEERDSDGIKARLVADLIRESGAKEEQFFITYGSSRPHTPLIAPQKYFDMYDPSTLTLTPAQEELDQNVPPVAKRFGNNWDIFKIREATPEREREALRAYYACATYIDDQIGLMLDALEEAGLADNTIVIFTSDHGFQLGEHGMWSKISLFEQSSRVPMMIRIPGVTKGEMTDAIVELVDLYPTILDILDIPAPHDKLEGTSMLPVIDNPDRDWKEAAFTTCRQGWLFGRSVRTETQRYTEWIEYADRNLENAKVSFHEFYDLENDPWEQTNLAGIEAHAEEQAQMAARLKGGWREALPSL